MSTGFVCKKCFDEGFDFGPKAVQVACSCEAGDRWLERRQAVKTHQFMPLMFGDGPTLKPSDKAGINEKGKVRRFWWGVKPRWYPRSEAEAEFWVRSSTGYYGVISCYEWDEVLPPIGAEYPADPLQDEDGKTTSLYFIGPFDPDRPDLDPPEVRQ